MNRTGPPAKSLEQANQWIVLGAGLLLVGLVLFLGSYVVSPVLRFYAFFPAASGFVYFMKGLLGRSKFRSDPYIS